MKRQNGRQYFANGARLLGVALVIAAAAFSPAAQNNKQNMPPEVAFTVSLPRPHTHLLDIEMSIKHGPGEPVANEETLVMPVWTPGSYLIREFERQVQDFAATDAAGRPLSWGKGNQDSWRVITK